MQTDIFAPDYRSEPYWWDAAPRPELPGGPPPARADVAVVGSGYTGLAAALATARGGRDTLVLEAGAIGEGCSTRNGGQVSTSLKPGFAALAERHGPDRAFAMLREGHNALAFIADFIAAEGIDCDWQRVGRFTGAHAPAQYEALAQRLASQPRGLEVEAHMVPRAEQAGEIGTELYYGGAVYEQHAALQPARFHQGLLDRALAAGARVVPRCPVLAIRRERDGFTLLTGQGPVAAREVVVASNGYSGAESPALRRRVIPIGSYIIATEPLEPALAARLIPRNRVISDTRHVVFYYRLSPDRRRMVFGGRVALAESDPRVTAPRLRAAMVALFPELAPVRISHSWHGFVAFTFDTMPHLGRWDGVHYAMGYCGSGVSLATYFGTRIGQQVLGLREGRTALDDLPFPTRPLYEGRPWFLAPTLAWYRLLDRLGR
ncbi:MAG: FAD-binding oxidoreductase [Dongiaceae bacterium]